MIRGIQLVPTQFRFVAESAIRVRRTYYIVALLAFAALAFLDATWSGEGQSRGTSVLYALGLMAVAAPLCRSWVNDDVRLGYGAWWLQKPVTAFDLYPPLRLHGIRINHRARRPSSTRIERRKNGCRRENTRR